jgi:hypothetical protein
MSNISNAPHFKQTSFQNTSGGQSDKKPKDHTNTRNHTPITVDPKKAAQIDRTHLSTLGITPVVVQQKRDLSELIIKEKPGERLSEQDRKDNSSLRKFATILDSGRKLDGEQTKRLNDIIQRRQPPVEIPAQSTGSYAESIYSGLQSGFGLLSSGVKSLADLGSYKGTLSLGSFGLSLASVAADQFPATRQLSTGLSIAAGLGTVASGVIGLAQEGNNYLDGKSVNPWNLGNSIVQTLSGTGILTGSSAVRSASVFASTGLHAAKALHTGTFDHVGATIVGALSLAVGGEKVALANTVLTYGNLIQTGVAIWNKLEADSTQKSEVRALQHLVKILNTPVHTAADAIATTEKAAKFLQSANVGKLPQDSELGKLIHTLRQIPLDDSSTLSLLLAPLASLAKEVTTSNLGTFIIGGLMLGNLPGGDAQSISQQLAELRELTEANTAQIGTLRNITDANTLQTAENTAQIDTLTTLAEDLSATATEQAKQIEDIQTTQVRVDAALIDVEVTQNATKTLLDQTIAFQNQTAITQAQQQVQIDAFGVVQDQQKIQITELTTLSADLKVTQNETNTALTATKAELEAQKKITQALQDALDKAYKAIDENQADNEYTRNVAFRVAGVGLATVGVMLFAYAIKHCCFPTKAQSAENHPLMISAAREHALVNHRPLINIMTAQSQTLTNLWDVREALYTEVTQPLIDASIPAPQEPENAKTLRDTLAKLEVIQNTPAREITTETLDQLLALLNTLKTLSTATQVDESNLKEDIATESIAARVQIAGNTTALSKLPPFIELQGFRGLDLGIDHTAEAAIAIILNPGDIGNKDRDITRTQVAAMQTALRAYTTIDTTLATEINAIKTAAKRILATETTRIGLLTPEISGPIGYEITAFTDALEAIDANPPVSETAANFATAFQTCTEFKAALLASLEEYKETLTTSATPNGLSNTLLAFRALGLGVAHTADPTIAQRDQGLVILGGALDFTADMMDGLTRENFEDLSLALNAANTLAIAMTTEIDSIKDAAKQLITEQRTVIAQIPHIEDLELRNLEAFTHADETLHDVELGEPTFEIYQTALTTRAALRGEIITYINGTRAAIATTLSEPHYTELTDLRDLADDLDIRFDKTATDRSHDILTSATLPEADATDETLNAVTPEQFAALAATAAVRATIQRTIADETNTIRTGLFQKLEEERDRIQNLPGSLQIALAEKIASFRETSDAITGEADTHTLENFTPVFNAIEALNARTLPLLVEERTLIAALPQNLQNALRAELQRFQETSDEITEEPETHTLENFTAVFNAIQALKTRTFAVLIEERNRIAALPENLQNALRAELQRFQETSDAITGAADTHTLEKFTAVFNAIEALNTAVTTTETTSATAIISLFRAVKAKTHVQALKTVAVQTQLREQEAFNARIPAEIAALVPGYDELRQRFDDTSREAKEAAPNREVLEAARKEKTALYQAISIRFREIKDNLSQTMQTISVASVTESLDRLRKLELAVPPTADAHVNRFNDINLDAAFENIREGRLYSINDAQFIALQNALQAEGQPLRPLQDEVHAIKEAARQFVNAPLPMPSDAIRDALSLATQTRDALRDDQSEDNYVAAVEARQALNALVAGLAAAVPPAVVDPFDGGLDIFGGGGGGDY